jgi:hypothetical protein
MGTSSAFDGPAGTTPLVPSWLETKGNDSPPPDGATPEVPPGGSVPAPPARPPIPDVGAATRFTAARNNFSRFVGSDGRDRANLGRAMSHYVGTSFGGAKAAAAHMGSSRAVGGQLLNFLSDAVARGAHAALRALNLEALAGRPIEAIFLGLTDYVCPDGGTVDEGIARESFIETIADLADAGITDLDGLTVDQMQTVFELYATNAIEARLCNDIGAKIISMPSDVREAVSVQAQLHDFIRRGVADALTVAQVNIQTLMPNHVLGFVDSIYEQAFNILQAMGEAEAKTEAA